MGSRIEDHPPLGPSSEQSVGPSQSTVVPSPPEHEGNLKYIIKYLVQYVPVKSKKPSSSSRVTAWCQDSN